MGQRRGVGGCDSRRRRATRDASGGTSSIGDRVVAGRRNDEVGSTAGDSFPERTWRILFLFFALTFFIFFPRGFPGPAAARTTTGPTGRVAMDSPRAGREATRGAGPASRGATAPTNDNIDIVRVMNSPLLLSTRVARGALLRRGAIHPAADVGPLQRPQPSPANLAARSGSTRERQIRKAARKRDGWTSPD